jgi:hypothetical protein
MVLLYMLCSMPVFIWALLWTGGFLGDMPEGQFRTILYVLVGLTVFLIFIVMPVFVLPRLLRGADQEERSSHSEREGESRE